MTVENTLVCSLSSLKSGILGQRGEAVKQGRTGPGRSESNLSYLRLNRPSIVAIRAEETARGRHPPRR